MGVGGQADTARAIDTIHKCVGVVHKQDGMLAVGQQQWLARAQVGQADCAAAIASTKPETSSILQEAYHLCKTVTC